MLFKPIPKRLLIHTVVYHAPTGEGDGSMSGGNTAQPQTIKFARFEPTRKKVIRSDNTEVLTNGVLFIDAVNSEPFIIPNESGKIEFEGSELVIVQIKTLNADKLEPHHIEVMLQ